MAPRVDFAVVGGGFAGLSAALTLINAGRSTAVFDSGSYRNEATAHVHSIAGHDGRTPQELRDMIRGNMPAANAKIYTEYKQTVEEIRAEGTGAARKFAIVTKSGDIVEARAVILTTGIKEVLTIPGAQECWAKGLYHCAACFTVETFGKTGAILGLDQVFKGHLLFNANLSKPFAVLLNGVPISQSMQHNVAALKARGHEMVEPAVERLESLGPEGVRVHFKDGSAPRDFGMIAHQPDRELQARHLLESLGVPTKPSMHGNQMVEQKQMFGMDFGMTSVEGVWVAGDMCESFTLASVALASGTKAAGVAANFMAMTDYGLQMPMPPSEPSGKQLAENQS